MDRRIAKIGFLIAFAAIGLGVALLRGETSNDAAKSPYPERKKVDPIAANGRIFVDWPKPDVALVFTGEQDGYLEPCGCAGLENQLGGLKRRFTLLKELRDKGWPIVAMDLGEQEKRTGVQAGLKVDFSYRALAKMGYAAVGFGPEDLRADMLSIAVNLDDKTNPLVSANVAIGDFDSGYTKRYKIVEAGGMKIGVTSVLGKKELAGLANVVDLKFEEPYQAIPHILATLREAKCDQLVLLAHAEPDEAKDLARRFTEFDWVMAAHGAEVPPNEPAKIDGTNAHLVEVGHKGQYAVVVGLFKNGPPAFRYQRVPLDHRFADAPEIYRMHVDYQHQLQQLVEQSDWAGLGAKATPHPTGKKFAGSKVCADCHSEATKVYDSTPHFHATETLLKRTDPPRQFDPECISCHATGWEPQKYIPFESGYKSLAETPELTGNGCENCHGPAARHAAAENGDIEVTDAQKEALRAGLRLKVVENEGNKKDQVYKEGGVVDMCMRCHDLDNSPDFDFQKYWPKVKHVGKE
jgi:hypothetical protein